MFKVTDIYFLIAKQCTCILKLKQTKLKQMDMYFRQNAGIKFDP